METGTIEIVLTREESPLKFEKFRAELMEKVEGSSFVTTSRSYDRGRDAIGIGRSKGSHATVVLCTLQERQLETKVQQDAAELARNASPDRIVYCYNKPLSQLQTDKLTAIIRGIFSKTSIAVLGGEALAQLACKHEAIVNKYYGPELRAVYSISKPQGISAEKRGLVLALHTFGSEDAQHLRKEMSTAAVLNVISGTEGASDKAIAEQLSIELQLAKQLDTEFVSAITSECESDGLIE